MLIAMTITLFGQVNPIAAQDSKRYISEELTVFLHTGPSRQYRIIGSIAASAPVTVLQGSQNGEFAEIRDEEGRQAWIETQYIQDSVPTSIVLPDVTAKLEAAEASIAMLEAEKRKLSNELNTEKRANSEQSKALIDAEAQIQQLQEQLSTKDLDTKIRWTIYGGGMAVICIFIGIILTFVPLRKKKDYGWAN